jgi:hypothetical protein
MYRLSALVVLGLLLLTAPGFSADPESGKATTLPRLDLADVFSPALATPAGSSMTTLDPCPNPCYVDTGGACYRPQFLYCKNLETYECMHCTCEYQDNGFYVWNCW